MASRRQLFYCGVSGVSAGWLIQWRLMSMASNRRNVNGSCHQLETDSFWKAESWRRNESWRGGWLNMRNMLQWKAILWRRSAVKLWRGSGGESWEKWLFKHLSLFLKWKLSYKYEEAEIRSNKFWWLFCYSFSYLTVTVDIQYCLPWYFCTYSNR